jgi:hypothetical protein
VRNKKKGSCVLLRIHARRLSESLSGVKNHEKALVGMLNPQLTKENPKARKKEDIISSWCDDGISPCKNPRFFLHFPSGRTVFCNLQKKEKKGGVSSLHSR